MMLSQNLLLCPQPKICPLKLKTPLLFPNNQESKSLLRGSGKVGVLYNGYSYFTSPCHPLEMELPKYYMEDNLGIGIFSFFAGKNIFIAGATGFVGKVLVEKLLRSTEVGKIYLLIQAQNQEIANDRLNKEIMNSEVMKSLKEEHGKYFETFIRKKLVAVAGNICEANLGMEKNIAMAIQKDVDVIVLSAASTTLNDRYDSLLEVNVTAPQRLMRFSKSCKNLKLFTHISTAYVNGKKEGTIMERPLTMGENGLEDNINGSFSSFPRLDVADELNMAFKPPCNKDTNDYDVTKYLKRLGQDRADFFGWYNPYHLTKAMGEMILNEIREDIPLLVIRPAVIESIYRDPCPGWIQGNRVYDPVIISYGKGQLPAYYADPNVPMDIIPVDIVTNATIAAIAKHGSMNKPHVKVYHMASSSLNPITYKQFFEYLYQYFKANPLAKDGQGIPRIELFQNLKDFTEYTRQEIHRQSESHHNGGVNGCVDRRCNAKVAYASNLCKMYAFAGFFGARFHTGNTEQLLYEMSKEERLNFDVDVKNINWKRYLHEVHIPGVRRHIIAPKGNL